MKTPPGTVNDFTERVTEARPRATGRILSGWTRLRSVTSTPDKLRPVTSAPPDVTSEVCVNAEGEDAKKTIEATETGDNRCHGLLAVHERRQRFR